MGTGSARRRTAPRQTTRRPTSRNSPARAPGRRPGRLRLLLGLLAAAVLVGGGVAGCDLEEFFEDPFGEGQVAPGSTDVDVARARARLAELKVDEWASMRGYSRDRFSHWRSVDGCVVRQTVLARDGDEIEMDDDCKVVSGVWYSPFDGVTLTDPSDVDIDHVVPLANSWRTGAAAWDDERRAAFANDLDTPQLIAVSASSNRAKGDQDPSQWRPPERAYWCQYAHDWIAVKHHWELWVTQEEKDALSDMLDTCPQD